MRYVYWAAQVKINLPPSVQHLNSASIYCSLFPSLLSLAGAVDYAGKTGEKSKHLAGLAEIKNQEKQLKTQII